MRIHIQIFHIDADTDPVQAFQNNEDPDPGNLTASLRRGGRVRVSIIFTERQKSKTKKL